jgi:hypothetical protein
MVNSFRLCLCTAYHWLFVMCGVLFSEARTRCSSSMCSRIPHLSSFCIVFVYCFVAALFLCLAELFLHVLCYLGRVVWRVLIGLPLCALLFISKAFEPPSSDIAMPSTISQPWAWSFSPCVGGSNRCGLGPAGLSNTVIIQSLEAECFVCWHPIDFEPAL